MGVSSSKVVQKVSKTAATTVRKYPTRPPPPSSNTTNARPPRPTGNQGLGPTANPEISASAGRSLEVEGESSGPDLALDARMRQLGPVSPNPTLSNSSTFNQTFPSSSGPNRSSLDPTTSASSFQPSASSPTQSTFPNAKQNPALSLLTARYRLAEEAEQEFGEIGKSAGKGRQFLDVVTLRQVLLMREKGMEDLEIERKLELRRGVVGRLGQKGVVGVVG